MNLLRNEIDEFEIALKKGIIQKVYKYVFDSFSSINSELNKIKGIKTGAIYHGYLDMTYLPVFTSYLKENSLKVAIVFDYNKFQYSIWLSGNNKKVQKKVWDLIMENKWNEYHVLSSIENEDSIIELHIEKEIIYKGTNEITDNIIKSVNVFIKDVEGFLRKYM